MPDQNYNTGDGMTEVAREYVGGDRSDVEAGRACPHCRAMLTAHNKAVWEAGYAVSARHSRETVRKPSEEEIDAILTLVRGGWLKLELALEDAR